METNINQGVKTHIQTQTTHWAKNKQQITYQTLELLPGLLLITLNLLLVQHILTNLQAY
jgi:hypothetical protein